MDRYIDSNKKELIINGTKLYFEHDIVELEEVENLIFIRLSIPTNRHLTDDDFNNVFCITIDGEIKWRIKNISPVDNPDFKIVPIVGIDVTPHNELTATDFMGRKYAVNKESGTMSLISIVK